MVLTTRADAARTLEFASRADPVRPSRIALLVAILSVYCLVRLSAHSSVALRNFSSLESLSALLTEESVQPQCTEDIGVPIAVPLYIVGQWPVP